MIVSLFKRYPLVAGMASYGCVWSAASISQQKILSHHEINYAAVARNATVGILVMAPMLHGWYKLVGIVCGTGARTWQASLKISAVEQLMFGPVILTAFFVSSGILEGKSKENIISEHRRKFPTTYITSCCVFPFINFVNHRFVPLHYKIMYQATMSFLWSNFLCFVKEKNFIDRKAVQKEDNSQNVVKRS